MQCIQKKAVNIKWYSEDRIKTKLNGMSPVMYRLHSA
ncbi:IS3 family transposase [Lagierella massiliensis]